MIKCDKCGGSGYIGIDDKDKEIIDYVAKNQGCTFNIVRKAMNDAGILSTVTTNNRINRLVKIGELEDKKFGNHFHRLYLG